jgi:hypothetical protein
MRLVVTCWRLPASRRNTLHSSTDTVCQQKYCIGIILISLVFYKNERFRLIASGTSATGTSPTQSVPPSPCIGVQRTTDS